MRFAPAGKVADCQTWYGWRLASPLSESATAGGLSKLDVPSGRGPRTGTGSIWRVPGHHQRPCGPGWLTASVSGCKAGENRRPHAVAGARILVDCLLMGWPLAGTLHCSDRLQGKSSRVSARHCLPLEPSLTTIGKVQCACREGKLGPCGGQPSHQFQNTAHAQAG